MADGVKKPKMFVKKRFKHANHVMTTELHPIDKWKAIPWRKLRKVVFRLQVRIFKAQKNGNLRLVRKLQKLLLNSKAAKLLAIRQVTQLNMGKKTAGVDGKKALESSQRFALYEHLTKNWKQWIHQPLKRVWIPKADGTQRGLGIPTIADRAYQCLLKYALEPAAEANFNANSFGFRQGRGCHDVQQSLFKNLNSRTNGINKRILELDIEKCFDRIDHFFIMKSVQLPRAAKLGLFKAIKAGVKGEFPNSESGTPQGGVISPLLANIALHGLENVGHHVRYKVINKQSVDTIHGFRYADDVVFILKAQDNVATLKENIDRFLATRGLKVKEAKTRLVKSTEGFDFLGWRFGVKPNGKFISTPSLNSTKTIKAKVKEVMKDNRFTIEQRIKKCGSVIRGWRNYHKYCDMSAHDLWSSNHWTWKFIRKQGSYDRHRTNQLIKVAFPKVSWSVNSFIKVKGDKSPFDGDLIYWSKRENANYYGITAERLSKQKYTCTHCKLKFLPGDIVELHHQDGNHNNWKPNNLEVLHRECHQHQSIHREVRVPKISSPSKGNKAC
jgi:RNA-directed DNA polymerase